ncbi:MAG: twin-arginine translocation signal domain-containing protein [Chloroflexota bacterium]
MAVSRRSFLKGLGAGISVLVVGGGVYRAADQGVFSAGNGPAYEPWETWRTDEAEGALRLVQSGILASNPHNTQPWLFSLSGNRIELYADTGRHLGAMDPYLREMHIGLGCAIENMMLTAAATGYDAQLTVENGELMLTPEQPQVEKVATITLAPADTTPSALYDAIPNRHTNRYNYDSNRTVASSLLDDMVQLAETERDVKLFTYQKGSNEFQKMADATIAATATIITDHDMAHDSFAWVDTNWREVQEEKDGPYIDTGGVSAPLRAVVKMLPPISQQTFDEGWLAGTETALQNTDVVGFIAVRSLYDRAGAIRAGRAWQRMHLWATANDMAMQPINQLPEVADRERQLNQTPATSLLMDSLTQDASWRPTFAFRMGYPINDVLPSSRRPVDEVLL